jgi:hypothetical protein
MQLHQTESREQFMANRPAGTLVRVIRTPTAGLMERPDDDRLISVPGIEFSYSYVVGDHAWSYHETLLGDRNPAIIDFKDALFGELERTGEYYLYPVSRSF